MAAEKWKGRAERLKAKLLDDIERIRSYMASAKKRFGDDLRLMPEPERGDLLEAVEAIPELEKKLQSLEKPAAWILNQRGDGE